MEERLQRVLENLADAVAERLAAGHRLLQRDLDALLSSAAAPNSETHETDPTGILAFHSRVRVHHQPPSRKNAPTTIQAGTIANDLLALRSLPSDGQRRVLVYFTDHDMAGYLSNPNNGLHRLYDLKPGKAYLLPARILEARPKSFTKKLTNPVIDVRIRSLLKRDYHGGYGLRAWEVLGADSD